MGLTHLNPTESEDNYETIIVETEGRNLSVMQRMRILLARICYMDRDIYIIHNFTKLTKHRVAVKLFKHVVVGHMFNKTVIYNSNLEEYVELSDKIFILGRNSYIKLSGDYSKLKNDFNADDFHKWLELKNFTPVPEKTSLKNKQFKNVNIGHEQSPVQSPSIHTQKEEIDFKKIRIKNSRNSYTT